MQAELPPIKHGYVLSDLHLFAPWSSAEHYIEEWHRNLAEADFLVLNGDIFDFRWSTLPTSAATADAAIEWLRALVEEFPESRFFYVLGNHDAHVALIERLEPFTTVQPTFAWDDSFLQIGSSFFMHGDRVFSRAETGIARTRFNHHDRFHPFLGLLYHQVIQLGIHGIMRLVLTREKCAKRILRALQRDRTVDLTSIEDVYTGHTHVAFSDFEYASIRWHNTGSAVHDLHCRMLPVRNHGQRDWAAIIGKGD